MKKLVYLVLCAFLAGAGAQAAGLDISLLKQLDAMARADQEIRTQLDRTMILLKDASTSEQRAAADLQLRGQIDKMHEIDLANQQRLDALLAQGWPTRETIDVAGMSFIFVIVQHADLPFQLSHLDGIRAATARGDISPANLATLEDRIKVRQGLPQLYGTQIQPGATVAPFPIENEATLDQRRSDAGLKPICAYLKTFERSMGPISYPPCL